MSIAFESDHSINEKIYAHPDRTQFCDQWRCAKVEITLLVCKAYDSVQLLWGWNALLLHVVLLVDCMSLFSSLFIGCYLSLHACNAGCVGSASGKEPIGFVCTGWKWHWHCRCSTDFCSFMCIWRDGWLAFGVLYIWYVLLSHGCLLSWTLIFVSARLLKVHLGKSAKYVWKWAPLRVPTWYWKYWIVKSIVKTLKKYWTWPKCA